MPLDLPRADGSAAPLGAEPSPDSDNALLDAYSETVSGAVTRVAPAVAHVRVERAKPSRWGREGSGSGFIITPDGYLVTNSHVAGGAAAIDLYVHGGSARLTRGAGWGAGSEAAWGAA